MNETRQIAVETPKHELVNQGMANLKDAARVVYDAANFSILDQAHNALWQAQKDLEEAHEIIALYWDGFDLMTDGPDDEDVAHASALLNKAQAMADGIAEAYRVRHAPPSPPPINQDQGADKT